ncbi:hypothetical protein DB345_12330 [Spartobacteria bacterium LR76]|nr:hypothetical protein DB345_12330 [Spartobacteria bacterium LR76]
MKRQKYAHPLRVYAEQYQVSLSTIKRWSARDLNLDDPNAIRSEVLVQKHMPPNMPFSDSAGTDKALELSKTLLAAKEVIKWLVPNCYDRAAVEGRGSTREEAIAGYEEMFSFVVEVCWKTCVLIQLQGLTFEAAREQVFTEFDAKLGATGDAVS